MSEFGLSATHSFSESWMTPDQYFTRSDSL
jgi:hypothetical protein